MSDNLTLVIITLATLAALVVLSLCHAAGRPIPAPPEKKQEENDD